VHSPVSSVLLTHLVKIAHAVAMRGHCRVGMREMASGGTGDDSCHHLLQKGQARVRLLSMELSSREGAASGSPAGWPRLPTSKSAFLVSKSVQMR
jgi:hypothetical protein